MKFGAGIYMHQEQCHNYRFLGAKNSELYVKTQVNPRWAFVNSADTPLFSKRERELLLIMRSCREPLKTSTWGNFELTEDLSVADSPDKSSQTQAFSY
jgi:hypothetical protein